MCRSFVNSLLKRYGKALCSGICSNGPGPAVSCPSPWMRKRLGLVARRLMVGPLGERCEKDLQEVNAPDLVLVDREGNWVLVGEIKYSLVANQVSYIAQQLARHQTKYQLVATRDKVYIFNDAGPLNPLVTLNTDDIIRRYDVGGGSGTIYEHYLRSLLESWLLDVGQGLYPGTPPGLEELRRAGIFTSLANTLVVRERHE